MKYITDCLKMNKTYAEKFFYIFSRAEYALKASNLLEYKEYASPNWQKFAKEIRAQYENNKSKELKAAVDYIKKFPPRKQFNVDGQLKWCDSSHDENTPEIHFLVTNICQIRNNLFHGGKFGNCSSKEISRNTRLIKYSILILCELMDMHDEVKHYFHQPLL